MKKIYLIGLFSILYTSNLCAQGNCATAVEDLVPFNVPLPAIGIVAPAGPDYGSLDILTRPFWGYLMSCDSTSMPLDYDVSPVDPSALFGFVFWGPFQSKTEACNNLTASNIYLIKDSVSYIGVPFFTVSPGLLHTGPGELFIYMITTNDTTPNNSLISYSVGMQNGILNPLPCYLCNDEVSQMLWRNFCLITFDSLSQKTKLVWEKNVDAGVGGYVIYRSATIGGLMDSVGFVPESMPGEFIDLTSSPLQYQENYKMMPVDSCGNHYTLQEYYYARTLFLQTTPAGNNSANLNWSSVYGIAGANQFEPVVYIHRGPTPATMQIIDTIPVGVLSYTDIFSPPGQQYYALEHRRLTPCDPLRTTANSTLTSILSNPSGVMITGLPVVTEEIFSMHPVPADQELIVSFNKKMIGSKFQITDMSGKTLISSPIIREKHQIDVSGLAPGTYWLSVVGASKSVRKFVVSH